MQIMMENIPPPYPSAGKGHNFTVIFLFSSIAIRLNLLLGSSFHMHQSSMWRIVWVYVCVRYMYVIYLFCFVSFEKIHNRNRKREKLKVWHTPIYLTNEWGTMMEVWCMVAGRSVMGGKQWMLNQNRIHSDLWKP